MVGASALAIVELLVASTLTAQLPLEIDIDRARVDVAVTDGTGRCVAGLSAKDFILRQGSSTKPILEFTEIPQSQPTTIVFVIDDLSMRLGDYLAVQEALRRFVNEQPQPGRQISILRTSGGSGAWQQFTGDPQALRVAIDQMTWNPVRYPSDGLAFILQNACFHLLQRSGFKTFVLFTTRDHRLPLFQIWNVENSAWRAGVTVHVVEADGAGGIENRFPFNDGAQDIHSLRAGEVLRQQPLRLADFRYFPPSRIASSTRGLYFEDHDLYRDITSAINDCGFYTLAWSPGKEAFEQERTTRSRTAPPPAPRTTAPFNKITIKTSNSELHTRTREGFYHSRTVVPLLSTPRQQSLEALFSPFRGSDSTVRIAASFHYTKAGGYIESLIHADAAALRFEPAADGCETGTAELIWSSEAVIEATQPFSAERSQIISVKVCGDAGQNLRRSGINALVRDPVREFGAYYVMTDFHAASAGDPVTVLRLPRRTNNKRTPPDLSNRAEPPDSRLHGSARSFVLVPDLRSQGVFVCGLEVGTPPPAGTTLLSFSIAQDHDAAVRRFHAGEAVPWRYQVLNAGSLHIRAPATRARIVVLREGQLVSNGIATAVVWRDGEEATVSGEFRLDPRAQPGNYLLGAIAEDLARDKDGQPFTSAQWIDFEVVQ